MRLFYNNLLENTKISIDSPLECSIEQTFELFDDLFINIENLLGLVTDDGVVIQFTKNNKFIWLVEIPVFEKHGSYQLFCNKNQCKRLIEDLFIGANPFSINGFTFISFFD